MYYRTRKLTFSRALTEAFLDALMARPAAALLATPTILLYQSGPPPTPALLGDVTNYAAATFPGYASVDLELGDVVVLGGTDLGVTASALFVSTGPSEPAQSALGYLIDNGGTTLYAGEAFPAPLSLQFDGAFLELDLIIPLPGVFTPTVV